jgi:hypothetical protein
VAAVAEVEGVSTPDPGLVVLTAAGAEISHGRSRRIRFS